MLAESKDRVNKERAMRRRYKGAGPAPQGTGLMELTRDQLLPAGAAKTNILIAWRLVTSVPDPEASRRSPPFTFALRRDKLLCAAKGALSLAQSQRRLPEKLWQFYIQLTQVEAAFKDLKKTT